MEKISVQVEINAKKNKVWEHWNDPESIKGWAFASNTWECPHAENDLRLGGRFLMRMSAKDGSTSFDFSGTYTEVDQFRRVKYVMDKPAGESKPREVEVKFSDLGDKTIVEEIFDPETLHPREQQQAGWQSILNNFKKFVEAH